MGSTYNQPPSDTIFHMRSLSHLLLHFGIFLQLASSCGSLSILPPKLEHRRHARRHSFGRGHNRRHHIKSLTFLSFAKPLDYDDVSNDEEKGENATKILLGKQDMIQTFPLNESMSETNCDTEINSLHNNTTATLSLRTFIRDIQNRYSSVMRTAIISFFAGALFPLLFFIILFNHSYKDSSSSVPQNSGISRSFSSVQSANGAGIDKHAEKQKSVALYRSILEQLDRNYVEEINPLELFEISTRAMLSTLDPYSEYISPQDMENRQNLVGIGAFVMKGGIHDDESQSSKVIPLIPSAVALPNQLMDSQSNQSHDGFRVILSLEGYAFDAGIRVGDEIIAIDGYSVAGDSSANTLEQVRELLVGVPGSKVKVSFKRPGVDGVQTVEIERKPVQFPNVRYAGLLDKDIGYVQLRQFGIDAGESMKHAIQGLLDEVSRESSDSASTSQSKLKGLIIDLRDNSGGKLESGISVASLFVPEGTYLGSSQGSGKMFPKVSYISGSTDSAPSGSSNVNSFQNPKQMVDPGKTRVVVLTNHKTASASEFLAGVFQDLDIAVIMGSDTLGKGLGQRELGLPLGGGALKLSYHEFYTPSGRCVQRHQYKNNRNNVSMTQEKQSRQEAKLFYTANGRKLNNRRGIQMDYQVELPRKSLLSSLLSSSGAYFQFASVWSETHPWAPNSNTEFVMNDSIYNEFQSFVLREQKKGNLKLDEAFDDDQDLLNGIETLLSTGLQRPGVTKLREQIVEDLLKDFKTCRDISEEVERNILARYLPDSELVAKGLKSDALVQEAARILNDQKTYDHLLGR